MPAELLIVDAPFLLYRSYFALPQSIRGADGEPVNALLGAVNTLELLVDALLPRAVMICFGAESAGYRTALYPAYHAAREPMPEALARQFHAARELFAAFGWAVDDSDRYEADDLAGAYAAVECDAGGRALLVTGDRDLYQCAGESVNIALLIPGHGGFTRVDRDGVWSRYGVWPEQVPDFIALRGDPSDGLPGAPGIGAKTAATLLSLFGSLETLLNAVGTMSEPLVPDRVRPRIAQALREHAVELRAFREIATLQPIVVARPADRTSDFAGGAAAADQLGMGALAGRLAERAAGYLVMAAAHGRNYRCGYGYGVNLIVITSPSAIT